MDEKHPGIPVDAFGGKTIDPTKNVLDLVRAANERQDDLRMAMVSHLEAEIAALKDLILVTFKETMIERDKMLAERDKRYMNQYEALNTALIVGLASQKEATDVSILAQKDAINAALASADRAVSKAEIAAEKRFESVNEFRSTLSDQQRNLMPRAEAESRLNALSDKIGVLEGFRTETLSRGVGTKEGWGQSASAVALVVSVLALIGMAIALLGKFTAAVTP